MLFSLELFLIICFSAFIQSAMGFGFILFSLTIGSLFFSVKEFLPFCLIIGIFIDFSLMVFNYKHRPNRHFDFIIFGLLGTPIGVYFYFLMEPAIFEPLLGVLVIISVILLLYDKVSIPTNTMTRYFYGFLTGALAGAFGISGPFVSLIFLSDSKLSRKNMIFLMNTFFFGIAFISLIFFYQRGIFTGVNFSNFSLMFGSAIIGYLLGTVFGNYTTSKRHQRFLLLLVLISAMFLIIP